MEEARKLVPPYSAQSLRDERINMILLGGKIVTEQQKNYIKCQ